LEFGVIGRARHGARDADRDAPDRSKRLTTLSKIVGQMPLVTVK
jgi:hypothetical protein